MDPKIKIYKKNMGPDIKNMNHDKKIYKNMNHDKKIYKNMNHDKKKYKKYESR